MTTSLLLPNFIIVALLGLVISTASFNQDGGDLSFNENTMIMSHNSAANKDAADGNFFKLFGCDQQDSIYEQLTTNGVRGLSLDIKLDNFDASKLRLIHGPFDYGDFETEMQAHLLRFLEQNENAVVAINFEVVDEDDVAIRSTILANLKSTFSNLFVNGVSLADMTFKYNSELWASHDEWPTLNEMRSSGQRLFVFHDKSYLRSTEYGFIFRYDAMKENFWEGLEDCTERYQWDSDKVSFPNSSLSWSRLFFMNHFDSVADTVGEDLLGGGTNGWGRLYPRIKQCMESNGSIKPNFISLDWVLQVGEALEVAQYLNLNFGGRIGSGQRCLDDSHCATEACNTLLDVCQCKECLLVDSDGFNSCLGCEAEQYCAPVTNSLNECLDNPSPTTMPVKEPTASPTTSPSALPSAMLRTPMPVDATVSPTASPTASVILLPTEMPAETTVVPVTTSPSPTTNSTGDLPTGDDNTTTLAPTAPVSAPATTQTPAGVQSQANIIANAKDSDEYKNNASAMFETLVGTKIVLVIGVLGHIYGASILTPF